LTRTWLFADMVMGNSQVYVNIGDI
jgi:hypothetical protein